MDDQRAEDMRDTALKLEEIRIYSPEDYFYVKGWIHCLLQKAQRTDRQPRKPPRQMV